jgi:hypothetical protein
MAEDKKDKPFIIRQLNFEIREAEKELAQLKKEKASETDIRAKKEELEELKKELRQVTTGSGEERREARRDAMSDYYNELGGAWIAALVKQDPTLRRLVEEAIRKGWDETEFLEKLYITDWWTDPKKSASWKAAFQQEYAADKTTWNKSLEDAKIAIQAAANEIGLSLDGKDMDALARRFMYQGWADNGNYGLRQWLATQARRNINPDDPDDPGYEPGGQAAVTVDDLKQRARDYGLTYADTWYARQIARMTDPASGVTLDTVILDMVKDARSKYPVWADRLNEEYSVRDAAGGYLGVMSQYLELADPDEIDLDDPLLQQAWTSVVDEKGQAGVMSLWDFQKLVRKDERWQQTDNAHTTYTQAAENILQMFGFRG